jgi:uncharacterized repeat protein (TIGR01451 family)
VVGSDVQFEVVVTNRSASPATGVMVSDQLDEGLEHASAARTIERDLVDLPPGGVSKLAVTLHVSKAGGGITLDAAPIRRKRGAIVARDRATLRRRLRIGRE